MKEALHRQSLTLTTSQSLYHLTEKTLDCKECNPYSFTSATIFYVDSCYSYLENEMKITTPEKVL